MQELKDEGFIDANPIPQIHCTAFEDNSGALELARTPKMRPRTKHINIVYHHFRSFVKGDNPKISVHAIGTLDQTADMFTKPLDQNFFQRQKKSNITKRNSDPQHQTNLLALDNSGDDSEESDDSENHKNNANIPAKGLRGDGET